MTPSEYRLRAGPPPIRDGKVETQPGSAREDHHRVLIVDDDQTTRETLEAVLRVAGYVAEVRTSGREAIEAVLRTRPEVILLDYHLPDTDGLSCLRTLRRKLAEPNLRPPVVLLTADWELERESEEIRALGGIYMSKLSDLDEVERVVHSLSDMHTLRADRAL